MSIASISQSNVLSDDVLLMIFQQLEGKDLVKCEALCRRWRSVLLAGTPWRRFFHRKVTLSHLWRKEQEILERNQQTLQTGQYRDVCRNLLQVERNWCTGRFEKTVYSSDEIGGDHGWLRNMTISDDYVAWNAFDYSENGAHRSGCFFLDKESNEITKFPPVLGYQTLNEMEVRFANSTESEVIVRDPKNQWTVNVGDAEENGYGYRQITFGSGRLVEYTRSQNGGTERLRIWKMRNQPTLLHERTFKDRNLEIYKVDEQFIVAKCKNCVDYRSEVLYFFSTETLELLIKLDMDHCIWEYDRGLFFQRDRFNAIVRILDVTTGTVFNDVHMNFRKDTMWSWVCSNSNVVVIGWKYQNKKMSSYLSVYDLEAVKKPNSDPGTHLLYTLQFKLDIHIFVMSETEIAINGEDYLHKKSVTILKFANFAFDERKTHGMLVNTSKSGKAPGFIKKIKNKRGRNSGLKQNPETNGNVKMKIIYYRRVDSYPRY